MDSVRVFSEVEIDYSVINGYEDLPSLSDTAYLDDSELEYRMIYLLAWRTGTQENRF